jgi:glycine/D-amino acid oxidase-like deaminating enzyme
MYSIDFFEKMGHYSRIGGLEVARVGDDERMEELKRKVGSGKAFGTHARLVSAKEAKEKNPLLVEDMIQGALWDPDAGLVIPRSQIVVGELVNNAEATGKLQTFANTPATGLKIENGRIKGVETKRGYIETSTVVVCAGLWGRLIAAMAGEDLPIMPVDHPLTFFGPFDQFAGPAAARTSAIRCCVTRVTRPMCATPATRRHPRAVKSNGATTSRRTRAWCIRGIFLRRNRLGCRLPSATWRWSRSWSRWSGPWSSPRYSVSSASTSGDRSTVCCR